MSPAPRALPVPEKLRTHGQDYSESKGKGACRGLDTSVISPWDPRKKKEPNGGDSGDRKSDRRPGVLQEAPGQRETQPFFPARAGGQRPDRPRVQGDTSSGCRWGGGRGGQDPRGTHAGRPPAGLQAPRGQAPPLAAPAPQLRGLAGGLCPESTRKCRGRYWRPGAGLPKPAGAEPRASSRLPRRPRLPPATLTPWEITRRPGIYDENIL